MLVMWGKQVRGSSLTEVAFVWGNAAVDCAAEMRS